MDNTYHWVPFYEELANKLLGYSSKREELFIIMKKLSSEHSLMNYLHFEREDWWGIRQHQVDPFTVIGVLNRRLKNTNRTMLAKVLADTFEVKSPPPIMFDGIPSLNNQSSFYMGDDEIWELFIQAIHCADSGEFSSEFKAAFDKANAVNGNGMKSNTMALFWIRPNVFMPLDSNSQSYLTSRFQMKVPGISSSGADYVSFLNDLRNELGKLAPAPSLPELSHLAWIGKERDGGQGDDEPATEQKSDSMSETKKGKLTMNKNIILYGTPGTGKTYRSVQYAVSIVENRSLDIVLAENYQDVFARYLKYKEDGLVAFITFHQSYSYEEFIEGIRPAVYTEEQAEAGHEIEYEIHDGVFKAFCNKAGTPVGSGTSVDLGIGKSPNVWKVSLEGTGDNPTRSECMEKSHIRIGWDIYGENISDDTDYNIEGGRAVLNTFYNKMQIGDIVFSCYTSKTIDAIGIIVGEPEWHDEYPRYKRLRDVKWLVKGIDEDIVNLNAGKVMTLSSVYKLSISASDAIDMIRRLNSALFSKNVDIPNRVFIIDEINRGNISKVFGELITLIEPTKRIGACEQLRAILPYSGQIFGVPDNVYIIGTMNTADRSIAILDTALRRRFSFVETQPDSTLLKDVRIEGIDISRLLDTLNKRITVLLDREHTIGHSYLLPLRDEPTLERLAVIFESSIIPLLKEYFYDDYEKIQLVLGDNQKTDDEIRFIIKKTDSSKLFGNADIELADYFEMNSGAFVKVDAYAFIS